MVDSRIENLAKLCVQYSVEVKPKEKVFIQGNVVAFPLIKELYRECLLGGAYPTIIPSLDLEYLFFKYAKEHQLRFVPPLQKFLVKDADVAISISCEPYPKRLTNIDPEKIRTYRASKKEIMEIFLRRTAERKLRWVVLPYPINDQAQEAAMSLEEYEDFVFSGCLVDRKNPVTEWKKIHQHQEKICEFLNQVSKIHIVGENTDLLLNVKDRKWINCSGKLNMLFDEKMGGTIHMALGASIPESGGLNKSAIHWDIVKDMKKEGEIYADNKLFYKNGKFLIK